MMCRFLLGCATAVTLETSVTLRFLDALDLLVFHGELKDEI